MKHLINKYSFSVRPLLTMLFACIAYTGAFSQSCTPIPIVVSPTSIVRCGTTGTATTWTASNGTNYRWYVGVPSGSPVMTGSTFTPTLTGNYFLLAIDNCGIERGRPLSASFNALPVMPTVSNMTIGFNDGTVVKPIEGLSTGDNFKWYADDQTTLLSVGAEFYTGELTVATSTYYVSRVNGPCESSKDAFTVSTNTFPFVNAGADKTISLPTSSTTIVGSGSDAGGNVVFKWTKLSGPNVTMSGTTNATLAVSGVLEGAYIFRLTVTDNLGQKAYDDVVLKAVSASQTSNLNYTRSEIIFVPGITTQAEVSALPVGQKSTVTTYLDEMGRPIESVNWQNSPNKYDVVQPYVYDNLGRSSKNYLSVLSATIGNSKFLKALDANGEYAGNEIQNPYSDKPYQVTVFDNTPLNRVIEQGSTGLAWQPGGSSGTSKTTYGANQANQIRLWSMGARPESTTTWAANKLDVTTTTDFVNSSGQTVVQIFEDGYGNKVLERVKVDATKWADTYYVYDLRNNLRCIVTPALTDLLKTSGSYLPTQDQIDRWCYQYTYDNHDRGIGTKGPGIGWVYSVYDKQDRLAMQQDALQRLANTWNFIKYDESSRVVMTGLYAPGVPYTQSALQAIVSELDFGKGYINTIPVSYSLTKIQTGIDIVSTSYDNNYREYQATNSVSLKPGFSYSATSQESFAISIGNGQAQWDNAFPTKNFVNLTINYYDDYTGNSIFFQDPLYQFSLENFSSTGGEPFLKHDWIGGQLTGSSVKIINSNSWLHTINYYDKQQRPIQMISSNHLGMVERSSTLYDYTGKIIETRSNTAGSHLVEWTDLVNVVVENGGSTIRKTVASNTWGDAGAISVNVLQAGENGWVETQVQDNAKVKMIGLSDGNNDSHYNTIDYALYPSSNLKLLVYENGVSKITAVSYAEGDKLRIERVGATIYYKKNSTIIYQSTVPSSSRLIIDAAFYTGSSTLYNTYCSFGSPEKYATATKRFSYDHAGRLLKIYHRYNSQPEIVLTALEYDELGQLKDKKIHSVDNGSSYLQSTDYAYNIRGWLTKSNSASGSDAGETDYFGFEMAYDVDGFTAGSIGRKDGSLTAVKWRNDLSTKKKLYTFGYDNLSQLTSADFKAGSESPWSSQVNFFSENNISFDINGNIKSLKRFQKKLGYNQSEIIDDLEYSYGTLEGNQLKSVLDKSTSPAKSLGFNDGNTVSDDYTFDVNGNIISDKNKGITSITYNTINLQDKVTFSDGSYTQYFYDATGTKLGQTYFTSTNQVILKTDYTGRQIFIDDVPVMSAHDEGRLLPPSPVNQVTNYDANGTNGYTPNLNVSLTSVLQTGQTYVKVVSNQATGTPGVLLGTYTVKPGERYSYKVLGYRETTHNAYLYVNTSAGNLLGTTILLPQGSTNETWATGEFVVPGGVTQITLGVLISSPAVGATFYINQAKLFRQDWEYQYFLTDQFGSARMVLSTDPSKLKYAATFESEHAGSEESTSFFNVNTSKISAHPSNTTPGGNEVIAMDNTYRIGPSRSLKVYPGDEIDASVSVYYDAASGLSKAPVAVMSNALIAVMTGGALPGYEGGITMAYQNSASAVSGFTLSPNNGNTRPSAFLNYILFDENYMALEAKSVPVGASAGVSHIISFSASFGMVNVKEVGYMFVYLSYDNENTNPVYFDDLRINHIESPVVQVNDYYPFGLTSYSWVRDGEYENRFLYQGKELDSKTGWQNFHARQYDPALGRWFAADPADQFSSPYVAMGNSPTNGVDPDGKIFVIDDIIAAAIGGVVNLGINAFQGNLGGHGVLEGIGRGFAAFGAGAVAGYGAVNPQYGGWFWGGAVVGATNAWLGGATTTEQIVIGAGVGMATGVVGGALGAGVQPLISSMTSGIMSPVLNGVVSGGLSGVAVGGVMGGMMTPITGQSFWDGVTTGAMTGAFFGAAGGGFYAGVIANLRGFNLWTGAKLNPTPLNVANLKLPSPQLEEYVPKLEPLVPKLEADVIPAPVALPLQPTIQNPAPVRIRLGDFELVDKAGALAQKFIPQNGRFAGLTKHKYATALLKRYERRFGSRGFEYNKYFNKSTGRGFLDVVNNRTNTIYDWKFGTATMSHRQFTKYQNSFRKHTIVVINRK